MAVSNGNKAHAYDALGRLNASFARIHRNIADLDSCGVFNPTTIKTIKNLSNELQANANVQLLDALRDVEQKDWTRFGRARKK
jgi:hypothetical protein